MNYILEPSIGHLIENVRYEANWTLQLGNERAGQALFAFITNFLIELGNLVHEIL